MTYIFWFSIAIVAYTYFGYPLYIWLRSRLITVADAKIPEEWPSITFVVPVYNDLPKALKKIENLQKIDYPSDKTSILFISDGSDDGTNANLATIKDIEFISYPVRQGKPTALNEGIKAVKSDIVIFTDVRQEVKHDAAKKLVARLLEADIGAVSGELVLLDPETHTGSNVSLYWKYEKFIRLAESKLTSVAGVTGALYAIKTKDYTPLSADTLLDDFEVPIEIIKQGQRCILEPGAIIYDYPQEDTSLEKVRKTRTLTGNFQSFGRHRWLFSPTKNPIWFQFISHKVLRLMVPYFLLLALVSSALIPSTFYQSVFFIQLLFYILALLSNKLPELKKNKLINLANVFVELNWAAVVAFRNYLKQEVNVKWDKTS